MSSRRNVRQRRVRGALAIYATLLTAAVIAVSSEIVARPTTRRGLHDASDTLWPRRGPRTERAACGICGHVGAMADAIFCADCGLLVHQECFGGYCDDCCQPRCTRCAARAGGAVCVLCDVDGMDSPRRA